MFGWRARIGLIAAHSNVALEPEFNRLAPQGVTFHTTRIRLGGISVEDMRETERETDAAARLLTDINARAIVYACNGANIAGGADADVEQARKISGMTGLPTILASSAVVEALHALEIKRVVVATPYPPALSELNDGYWRSCGIDVLGSGGVDLGGARGPYEPFSSRPVSKVGMQGPAFAYNLARKVFDSRAEAILVIGCGVPSIEVAEQCEADFGVPFVSSNLALAWASLQAAGLRQPITGFGRLLREQPELRWHRIPRP